jgi:hypothetical protein
MGFRFQWYDDEQTTMHYIAEGDWNWRDYHACVRASLFSMHRHEKTVDSLIDLRASTRRAMPSGVNAHVRSFGKVLTPALSGRALVIGMPDEALAQLGVAQDHQLDTPDGLVRFVDADGDEAAKAILQAWKNAADGDL